MARVLIVYGTAYGQTERIVREIARVLRESEHEVRLERGDQVPADMSLGGYDGIVVAASVQVGRHQRYIERFVRQRATWLMTLPSAFVSVCGAMAAPGPEAARTAQGYRDRFLASTGWHPSLARSFAGGLAFSRYRPWVRWVMKLIVRRAGGPTDTSRDYDFTDWPAVAEFAREFASALPGDSHHPLRATPAGVAGPKCDLDALC